jgi:hypothetical protein
MHIIFAKKEILQDLIISEVKHLRRSLKYPLPFDDAQQNDDDGDDKQNVDETAHRRRRYDSQQP